uniref:CSD domain-containing protein n=1 Tax=Zooxanthella nutricula TaxID=1333877 RepID=A0A7S2NUQ4_9DINO
MAFSGAMTNGTVKVWLDERGMGFITPEAGGEDVFVHRSALLDGNCLQVGAPVVFEDGVDPLKGKRCAANVQGATNAPGGGKGKGKWSSNGNRWSGSWKGGSGSDMMGFVMGMMAQMMKGKGKGGKGGYGRPKISTNGKFVVDDSGGVLGEFVGTIRSYHDGKCYGFIECADLEPHGYKDVFLHGDMKKGYRVGHKVKFTAFLTKEGKCQAKELKSGLK